MSEAREQAEGPYLVLRLPVALCELPERAEVPLKTSQLRSRGRAGLPVTAAPPLPHTGPQGQQEVAHQELHPLRREEGHKSKSRWVQSPTCTPHPPKNKSRSNMQNFPVLPHVK